MTTSRLPSARPPDAPHRKVELKDIHKVVKVKRNQGKAQENQPHDKEDAESQNGQCTPNIRLFGKGRGLAFVLLWMMVCVPLGAQTT